MTANESLWFDAEHPQAAAGVVLQMADGRLILQLRDNIPGIDNPGQITSFGGGAEPGETSLDCALRELAEETGLTPEADALRFLIAFPKTDFRGVRTACAFYLLTGVDPERLVVTEGAAIILSLAEVATDPRVTQFCRRIVSHI